MMFLQAVLVGGLIVIGSLLKWTLLFLGFVLLPGLVLGWVYDKYIQNSNLSQHDGYDWTILVFRGTGLWTVLVLVLIFSYEIGCGRLVGCTLPY